MSTARIFKENHPRGTSSVPVLPSIKKPEYQIQINFSPVYTRRKKKTKAYSKNRFKNLLTNKSKQFEPSRVFEAESSFISLLREENHDLKQHYFNTYQGIQFAYDLPVLQLDYLRSKMVYLREKSLSELTVVFDLDQTLVHSSQNLAISQHLLRLEGRHGQKLTIGVSIRPFARQVLQQVSKFAQVVIFSSSNRKYTNMVLKIIDPNQEFIRHSLYKENCVNVNGILVKDLRVLANRDLKKTVIVDNVAASFGYQIDNGIPIVSWNGSRNDKELKKLVPYLKQLAVCRDVTEVNRKKFDLPSFCEKYHNAFLN